MASKTAPHWLTTAGETGQLPSLGYMPELVPFTRRSKWAFPSVHLVSSDVSSVTVTEPCGQRAAKEVIIGLFRLPMKAFSRASRIPNFRSTSDALSVGHGISSACRRITTVSEATPGARRISLAKTCATPPVPSSRTFPLSGRFAAESARVNPIPSVVYPIAFPPCRATVLTLPNAAASPLTLFSSGRIACLCGIVTLKPSSLTRVSEKREESSSGGMSRIP